MEGMLFALRLAFTCYKLWLFCRGLSLRTLDQIFDTSIDTHDTAIDPGTRVFCEPKQELSRMTVAGMWRPLRETWSGEPLCNGGDREEGEIVTRAVISLCGSGRQRHVRE